MKKKILMINKNNSQIAPLIERIKEDEYLMRNVSLFLYPSAKTIIPKNTQKWLSGFDMIISSNWLNSICKEYDKRDGQILIETTHGTWVKRIPWMLRPDEGMIDYILAPNKFSYENMLSVGYEESQVIKASLPRIEYYLERKKYITEKDIKKQLKIPSRKKIVLFAPSWVNTKKKMFLNLNEMIDKLSDDEVLVISPHSNSIKLNNLEFMYDGEVIMPNSLSNVFFFKNNKTSKNSLTSEDIMMYSERLITDYSSIIYDYRVINPNKKCEFFFPDRDQNQNAETIRLYKKNYSDWGKKGDKFEFNFDDPFASGEFDYYKSSGTEEIIKIIKQSLNIHGLTVVIPTQNVPIKNIKELMNSLDRDFVEKIILVSTEKIHNKFKNVEGIIAIKVNDGTKIEKLKAASEFVNDDDYVLVLDGDDILNPKYKPSFIGNDLTLSDTLRQTKTKKYIKVKYDTNNYRWMKSGYPYFGNHSIIVRGKIFNEVNMIFEKYDFQRHEDAVRSAYYISLANNIVHNLGVNDIPIKRRMIDNYDKASHIDDEKIGNWIIEANKLLFENEVKLVEDPYYRKSQISSINEVFETTERLIDKKIIKRNNKMITKEKVESLKK